MNNNTSNKKGNRYIAFENETDTFYKDINREERMMITIIPESEVETIAEIDGLYYIDEDGNKIEFGISDYMTPDGAIVYVDGTIAPADYMQVVVYDGDEVVVYDDLNHEHEVVFYFDGSNRRVLFLHDENSNNIEYQITDMESVFEEREVSPGIYKEYLRCKIDGRDAIVEKTSSLWQGEIFDTLIEITEEELWGED
jgi:hypothetical protein